MKKRNLRGIRSAEKRLIFISLTNFSHILAAAEETQRGSDKTAERERENDFPWMWLLGCRRGGGGFCLYPSVIFLFFYFF